MLVSTKILSNHVHRNLCSHIHRNPVSSWIHVTDLNFRCLQDMVAVGISSCVLGKMPVDETL